VKNKTYYNVKKVLKSNRKIAETVAKLIPLTHMTSQFSGFGTGTSKKSGSVNLA